MEEPNNFWKGVLIFMLVFSVCVLITIQLFLLMNIQYSIASIIPTEMSLASSTWQARIEFNNPVISGLLYINKINSTFYVGEIVVGEALLQDYYVSSGENIINLDYDIDHLSGVYSLLTGGDEIILKTRIDTTIFWVIPYSINIEPSFTSLTEGIT